MLSPVREYRGRCNNPIIIHIYYITDITYIFVVNLSHVTRETVSRRVVILSAVQLLRAGTFLAETKQKKRNRGEPHLKLFVAELVERRSQVTREAAKSRFYRTSCER